MRSNISSGSIFLLIIYWTSELLKTVLTFSIWLCYWSVKDFDILDNYSLIWDNTFNSSSYFFSPESSPSSSNFPSYTFQISVIPSSANFILSYVNILLKSNLDFLSYFLSTGISWGFWTCSFVLSYFYISSLNFYSFDVGTVEISLVLSYLSSFLAGGN